MTEYETLNQILATAIAQEQANPNQGETVAAERAGRALAAGHLAYNQAVKIATQIQQALSPARHIEVCGRRCDMAGIGIDLPSIDSRHDLQKCNEGCQNLSQCKRVLGK